MNLIGPSSGYDLRRFIKSSIAFFWDASFAQIYALIRRLEGAGWVSVQKVEQETRPSKFLYRITPQGRTALLGWLSQPAGRPSHREPFLLRVFFFDELSAGDRMTLIDAEAAMRAKSLARYRQIEASVPAAAAFSRQTLALGIAYEEMYLKWLEDFKVLARDGRRTISPPRVGEDA